MILPDKTRKIFFPAILTVFLVSGFFIWHANLSRAEETPPTGQATNDSASAGAPADAVKDKSAQIEVSTKETNDPKGWQLRIPVLFHSIGAIFFLILKLLNGLVWLGANLADYILKITSFTQVNVVRIGWEITRSLANMFFALILLAMAFDTILQTNKFPIKNTLPKLIASALLINFSLMFAGIIIDFAQVMTSYFLTAGAGDTGISANLTNGLKIVQTYNFSGVDQSIFSKLTDTILGPTLQMIVEQFMAIILFTVAAFSFFAMSFFLLARIVWIWFLLIFAPLAWVFMIVPQMPGQIGSLWSTWWKKFLEWTLFAPIYAFFLYLALTIAKNGVSLNTINNANKWGGATSADTLPLQSGFFKTPETILQYIVIIMILLAGLKIAPSTSGSGAGAIIGWGQAARKKIQDYAKRPGQWAYDAAANKGVQLAGKGLSAIGKVPGLGWAFSKAGRRLEAKGIAMETKPEERERHKAYANNLKTMSDLNLQEEIKHAYGIRKLLATRQAKERGLLDKTDDIAAIKKAMAVFGAYGVKDDKGKTKEQKELEETRFDTLDSDEERRAAIRRGKENGNLDKVKPVVFDEQKNPNAKAALDSYFNELSDPELDEQFKKWGKATKQSFESNLLKAIQAPGFNGSTNEIKKRETYASLTGNITGAFGGDAHGNFDDTQKLKLAGYIGKMTAASVAKIKDPAKAQEIKIIGQFASPDLVANVGRDRNASAEQKDHFRQGVENNAISVGTGNITDQVANDAKERLKGMGWALAQEAGEKQAKNQPKIANKRISSSTPETPVRMGRL